MKYPNEIANGKILAKKGQTFKAKENNMISLNITFLTCFLIHLEQGLHGIQLDILPLMCLLDR
jgi:hypothetical protein